MHKRDIEFFVLDMLLSIERICRYSKKLACVDDFTGDEVAYNIILRDLTIIGEAMNHILNAKSVRFKANPAWRGIVDFRNIVIHEYFGLSVDEVFQIIKIEIPALEQELFSMLRDLDDKKNLFLAVADLSDELRDMRRNESLAYLVKLKKQLKKYCEK